MKITARHENQLSRGERTHLEDKASQDESVNTEGENIARHDRKHVGERTLRRKLLDDNERDCHFDE